MAIFFRVLLCFFMILEVGIGTKKPGSGNLGLRGPGRRGPWWCLSQGAGGLQLAGAAIRDIK